MPEDPKLTVQVAAELKSMPPLWRLQLVRGLQILGVLAGLIGGTDVLNLVKVFSPQFAACLTVSGVALRFAAEPLILFIGDLVDDGLPNHSFRIPGEKVGLFLLLCFTTAVTLSLSSCGDMLSLGVTPEGCAMVTYGRGAKTYSAGPCIGADGKIEKYRSEWRNMDGTALRAERFLKTGATRVWYQAGDGSWLQWDSKAGVMLGPVPSEVTPSLAPPVAAEVIPTK
jgi:hypothetical protein